VHRALWGVGTLAVSTKQREELFLRVKRKGGNKNIDNIPKQTNQSFSLLGGRSGGLPYGSYVPRYMYSFGTL